MRSGRFRYRDAALWTLFILLGAGCGPGGDYGLGLQELDRGEVDQALTYLERAHETDPGNARIERDLGIAYYRAGDLGRARDHLTAAVAAEPGDGKALLHLGVVQEDLGNIVAAIATYGGYVEISRFSSFRGKIENRINALVRRRVRSDVRTLIETEGVPSGPLPEATVGALPFAAEGSSELSPLGAALGEWLATDLAKVSALTVVERLRLDAVLDELRLSGDSRVDPATAPRLGRLLPARTLVSGGLTPLPNQDIRLHVALVDVTTGALGEELTATGKLEDFFRIEKDLAFSVLTGMGVEPTPRERREIEEVPTRDLAAALAFGSGLLAERAGDTEEARLHYERAFEMDRGFSQAAGALRALPTPTGDTAELVREAGQQDELTAEAAGPSLLRDRLEATDDLTGGKLWPDPVEEPPTPDTETIPDPPGPPPRPGGRP